MKFSRIVGVCVAPLFLLATTVIASPVPKPQITTPDYPLETVMCARPNGGFEPGKYLSRRALITQITAFCSTFHNQLINSTTPLSRRSLHSLVTDRQSTDLPTEATSDGFRGVYLNGALVQREVNISVTVVNPDYRFMVDGEGPGDECGRLLRRPVDECDVQGEDVKFGGRVVGESAVWEIRVFGGEVVGS